jgi:antitoxin MazE
MHSGDGHESTDAIHEVMLVNMKRQLIVTIERWGSSLAVRIPVSLAKRLRVHAGNGVEMQVVCGALVLRFRRRLKYGLKDLLGNCKRHQLHGEIDFGPDVGRESLK